MPPRMQIPCKPVHQAPCPWPGSAASWAFTLGWLVLKKDTVTRIVTRRLASTELKNRITRSLRKRRYL